MCFRLIRILLKTILPLKTILFITHHTPVTHLNTRAIRVIFQLSRMNHVHVRPNGQRPANDELSRYLLQQNVQWHDTRRTTKV